MYGEDAGRSAADYYGDMHQAAESSDYIERDLADYAVPSFPPRAGGGRYSLPVMHHPPAPRSTYSTPTPSNRGRSGKQLRATSLEVGSVYSAGAAAPGYRYPQYSRDPLASPISAPAMTEYGVYGPHPHHHHQHAAHLPYPSRYHPQEAYLASPDEAMGMQPNDRYWYAEPPQFAAPHRDIPGFRPESVASSRTLTSAAHQSVHSPLVASASVAGSGGAVFSNQDLEASSSSPGFFDVEARHHVPGRRSRDQEPMHAVGALNAAPNTGPYGDALPNFPAWSRTWYGGHLSADGHAYTMVPPAMGPGSGNGSGWESETLSRSAGNANGQYGRVYGKAGDHGISDYVKEERMRMLEKEFGAPKVKHAKGQDDDDASDKDDDESEEEEQEELVLGSVDSRGRLITERPKWMLAVRWLQILCALTALACGVGGALLIKTASSASTDVSNDDTIPAPKGTMPAYIMYAASGVTVLILFYLFLFRPCCCDPMRKHLKESESGAMGMGGLGGMIIPVLSGGGGPGPGGKMPKGMPGGPKRGLFGKRKEMMGGGGAPTVNLIVDPALLGGGSGKKGRRGQAEDSSSDEEERLPGEGRKRRRKRRKGRAGVMETMKLQARWRIARSSFKVFLVWDILLCIVWIAVLIVVIALGKKCPPGTAKGWCDAFNGNIAAGAIFAAVTILAIYLDWRTLAVSKHPPKHTF
ncbi:hypothetical protein IE81DRAFT_43384 [Ceraceosorus guamensis]|uniref:Uncharacterized protein n=1 Tax=Ceraceosorus guamensis TaxID=1522189 RepID=A0A316VNL8_9BASI|nr:hypothetical protein IE81DRAFT_43384 [Ceraceosorus guamensis]PWN39167.1 hypothetical protein IE81DRAFT_43384 [Ceraceosorus guamensis]